MELNPRTQQAKTTLWILWGALCMSQLLYVMVGYVIRTSATEPIPDSYQDLLTPLLLAAGVVAGGALFGVDRFLKPVPKAQMPQAYFVPFLLKMALSESVGIFGFLLFYLGAPWELFLGFVGVALLLMASFAPTDGRLLAFARDLENRPHR